MEGLIFENTRLPSRICGSAAECATRQQHALWDWGQRPPEAMPRVHTAITQPFPNSYEGFWGKAGGSLSTPILEISWYRGGWDRGAIVPYVSIYLWIRGASKSVMNDFCLLFFFIFLLRMISFEFWRPISAVLLNVRLRCELSYRFG